MRPINPQNLKRRLSSCFLPSRYMSIQSKLCGQLQLLVGRMVSSGAYHACHRLDHSRVHTPAAHRSHCLHHPQPERGHLPWRYIRLDEHHPSWQEEPDRSVVDRLAARRVVLQFECPKTRTKMKARSAVGPPITGRRFHTCKSRRSCDIYLREWGMCLTPASTQ